MENSKGHGQEIRILEPIDFPAMYEGKVVGWFKKPAGSSVKIIEIHPPKVSVSFNGGIAEIPIEKTDLLERANLELEKFNNISSNQAASNTLVISSNSISEFPIEVSKFLEKPILESKEVLDCFIKNPTESFMFLNSKVVKINGLIQKIRILGIDSDKVEITLASTNIKRLVLKLKLENIIDKKKIEGEVKNKLVLENGQLKLISDLVHSGGSYYYYYWNGYRYVRRYYYGTYYDGYGYRHYDNQKILESPICSEGADISKWSSRLSSTNSASIYFDVINL
jgi:hypothetical protein